SDARPDARCGGSERPGAGRSAQTHRRDRAWLRARLGAGAGPVIAREVERREEIGVRIPMRGGVYEATFVIVHSGALTGVGEAPHVTGRAWPAALHAAEEAALLDLRARAARVPLAGLLGCCRRSGVR